LIREWAEKLAKPTEYNNGVAACPFALPAIIAGEVKTVVTSDLWTEVLEECAKFCAKSNKVTMLFNYEYEGQYSDLEDQCMSLNNFFANTGIDLWLLSYMGEEAVIFVQRWSELENAAAKLEKLGYYKNYEPDIYKRHILSRRKRSDISCQVTS